MISQYTLAKAIADAIKDEYDGVTTGVIRLPIGATVPSVIVTPLNVTNFEGSMADSHEAAEFMIQITSVGDTVEQAAGIQAAVYGLLLQRSGSGYTTDLSSVGAETMDRIAENIGAIVPGENVYKTDDTYIFKESLI